VPHASPTRSAIEARASAPKRDSWLATAREPAVVRRSLRIAAVVGTLLVAINYTDRALAGTLATADWLKMGLTYCVPYAVATYAAVEALRRPTEQRTGRTPGR
jgi:hypothetical protein